MKPKPLLGPKPPVQVPPGWKWLTKSQTLRATDLWLAQESVLPHGDIRFWSKTNSADIGKTVGERTQLIEGGQTYIYIRKNETSKDSTTPS